MSPSNNHRRFISVADEYVQLLVDASPLPSVGFDPGGNIIAWNDAAGRLLGWSKHGSPRHPHSLLSPARLESAYQDRRETERPPRQLRFELRGIRGGGRPYLISVSVGHLYNNKGDELGALGVLVDLPTRGPLPPVPPFLRTPQPLGQRDLMCRMAAAVARAKDGAPSSLMLIQIDCLETAPARSEARGTDHFATRLVPLLKSETTAPHVLATLGPGRYGILLFGATEAAAAYVAARIRQALARISHLGSCDLPGTTASIGVAPIDGHADPVSVLASAEAALADAMGEGGGHVATYCGPGSRARRRRRWAARVDDAIRQNRLRFELQPVINLDTGSTHHFRASSHVRTENGASAPLAEFLPPPGDPGLAVSIDRWALREAIRSLGERPHVSIYVPVSDASLMEPSARNAIAEEVARGGTAAGRLGIELDERTVMADVPAMKRWMSQLAGHGCHFSLAGYGTTKSSLVPLRELPLSFVVIGRPFTSGVGCDRTVRALVRSLASAARASAKEVIAEGTDNKGAIRLFRQMGIKYVQGAVTQQPGPEGLLRHQVDSRPAA